MKAKYSGMTVLQLKDGSVFWQTKDFGSLSNITMDSTDPVAETTLITLRMSQFSLSIAASYTKGATTDI